MQVLRNLYVFVGFILAVAGMSIGISVFHIPEGAGRIALLIGSILVGIGVATWLRKTDPTVTK